MTDFVSTTHRMVIAGVAKQIISEAEELEESASVQWLDDKLKELFDAGIIDEPAIRTIRNLVNEEIELTFQRPSAVVTNEDRGLLVSKNRLAENTYQWSMFLNRVEKKTSRKVARALADASDRVVLSMPDPKSKEQFCSKGLVIGDVQAGKTNNYTAVINRASDLGYKLIIVLTGMTEGLRRQTQIRLDNDFVGRRSAAQRGAQIQGKCGIGDNRNYDLNKKPATLTDFRNDFSRTNSNGVFVAPMSTSCLIVTKKNKSILEAILSWIESQCEEGRKFESPVLLIDDEADNASVNTGDEDSDPKAINFLIRSILNKCGRISYVAYTATPFANIFIDPESESDSSGLIDLYPSHFIVALSSPSNYCGGEFFYKKNKFAEGSQAIKHITDCETYIPLKHKADLRPASIPPSMRRAIASFFLVCAVKDIRRSNGSLASESNKFDSCLINVSRFTAVQDDLRYPVQDCIDDLWAPIELGNSNIASEPLNFLKATFEEDISISIDEDLEWNSVFDALKSMEKPELRVIHSESTDSLDYDDIACPRKVIAIGGFKLSRGLTLEGLTVSYFYRRSLMYDTLMQMARWFGYRDGYRDLLRLYSTKESCEWYAHITESTIELKSYLVEMERDGLEPKDFGIKVRSHEDSLLVTAKNKMRTSKEIATSVSYKNQMKETVFVDRRAEINNSNLLLARKFLKPFEVEFANQAATNPGYLLKSAVPSDQILLFLREINFHNANRWSADRSLVQYLGKHSETLWTEWDVALISVRSGRKENAFSDLYSIGVQRRSPKKLLKASSTLFSAENDFSVALSDNRKVSASSIDYIGIPNDSLTDELKDSSKKAREWKGRNHPRPLLALHLIDLDLERSIRELDNELSNSSSTEERLLISDKKRELTRYLDQFGHEICPHYLAVSISVPDHDRRDDSLRYQLNLTALKELFAGLTEEELDE